MSTTVTPAPTAETAFPARPVSLASFSDVFEPKCHHLYAQLTFISFSHELEYSKSYHTFLL